MKWIVGIDLRSGDGPVHFARWLLQADRAPDGEQFVFVHVLEEEHLLSELKLNHLDEVLAEARAAAERLLAREGVPGEIRITQALTAEEGLETARAELGADGILIGRSAPREGLHLVRLGRVARRLLRSLPAAVVVVPPDLQLTDIGAGPIGALTDLAPDAVGALRFAERLAGRLARPLVALHAIRPSHPSYNAVNPSVRDERPAEASKALDAWLVGAGVRPARREILVASPVDGAAEWAQREGSPLLVAGTRRLSTPNRILGTSTGSTLASSLPLATAVVPP